jgi:hypothetical protein
VTATARASSSIHAPRAAPPLAATTTPFVPATHLQRPRASASRRRPATVASTPAWRTGASAGVSQTTTPSARATPGATARRARHRRGSARPARAVANARRPPSAGLVGLLMVCVSI